jgi:UDP-N-acetyl-D-mannosaminuronate dehydrogenase
VNKAQLKAKEMRRNKRVVSDLQMQGARYALRVYREAVEITLGLGHKRLARVDEKFMELIHRDETIKNMKERGEL